ncbi:hypothetical protein WDU94_005253 [Cyamophila willieti]
MVSLTVPDSENVGSDQVTHSTFVQYVENGTEQAIYTNGQMAYPVYTVGDSGTMYTAASSENQFFAPAGTTPVTYTQEVAYIVEDQAQAATATSNTGDPLSPENPASLSHVTKISPATVQWLIDNYETAEGVSLPRSSLFNHYIRHCAENKLDAVNAASFGKLIRSVFIGLRTRRLGTRGNSKYHYYGIRVKPDSPLNNIQVSDENGSPRGGKKYKLVKKPIRIQTKNSPKAELPEIDLSEDDLPEDCTIEDVDTFRSIYREHCEAFLDAIVTLDFSTIESLWREFWRSQDNNNGDECEEEKYLSKSKLFCLSKCLPVQAFVRRVDFLFYQSLVEVLIPDVLRPIPGKPNFTKAARQFLLKWSFYSSMVIRDLTLRSAASFGSFHLIRLLYDEYMFYLIEHQVALATGETPIAVIGSKESVLAQEHTTSHTMNSMDNGMYHHENNTILVHESDLHITPKRIKLN